MLERRRIIVWTTAVNALRAPLRRRAAPTHDVPLQSPATSRDEDQKASRTRPEQRLGQVLGRVLTSRNTTVAPMAEQVPRRCVLGATSITREVIDAREKAPSSARDHFLHHLHRARARRAFRCRGSGELQIACGRCPDRVLSAVARAKQQWLASSAAEPGWATTEAVSVRAKRSRSPPGVATR